MQSVDNPFQSPKDSNEPPSKDDSSPSPWVPRLITATFVFAVLVGLLSLVVPVVGSFINPRFGWIGLILCMNPLIFLFSWLKSPTRHLLFAAAFMTLSVGGINACQLLLRGTVSQVSNSFVDRLHSSWFWSVLPFLVAGMYLIWHALHLKKQPDASE